MNEYVKLAIWAAVIGGLFIFFWRKGLLRRFADYIRETNEELKKCTWPSWDELKGSTVVVVISTVLLGAFTVGVDFFMAQVVKVITHFKL